MPVANPYFAPVENTEPIAGTTAGLWTFTEKVSHMTVSNLTTETMYMRFNSASAAAVATHDIALVTGSSINIAAEEYGLGVISTVSIWFPAGATVTLRTIRGI